jgi:hypothetical protein
MQLNCCIDFRDAECTATPLFSELLFRVMNCEKRQSPNPDSSSSSSSSSNNNNNKTVIHFL